jgi:sugar phosphate isomerase/epimerase
VRYVMFTKHLMPLSIEEAGHRVAEIGFEGLDLTLRPGGHIAPENAADLAGAAKAVRAMGLDVPMITTNVTAADEPYAGDIFRAAAAADVRQIKLGYWAYRGFGQIQAQLDETRRKLDGLEALAGECGVQANVHIHCDDVMSADAAIVYLLLQGRDRTRVGAYVDPGHMTVEGGGSGWRMGLDLLSPWVNLVAVKSMAWTHQYDPALAQERWDWQQVPLRQGLVPWPEVFRYLHQIGYDGVVSLHSEYQGSRSWRDLSLEELLAQSAEDLAYVKYTVARACAE